MIRLIAIAALLVGLAGPALAASQVTQIPSNCNMAGAANYSGTVTGTSAVLIPAPPDGVQRSGIFIELLTASSTLAINPTGAAAVFSPTTAGMIMVSTGASAPQNLAYINTASLGFTPQGAITAIASGSVTVTAYACPR